MITGVKVEVLRFKVASQYSKIFCEGEIQDEINKFLLGKSFIDMKVNTVETGTSSSGNNDVHLYYTIIYK